jgi:hypothetical protein
VRNRRSVRAELKKRLSATVARPQKKTLSVGHDAHVVSPTISGGFVPLKMLITNAFLWIWTARRPAQECTCERAGEENSISGAACECGKRPANACKYLSDRVAKFFVLIFIDRHMREESGTWTARG